MNGSGMKKSKNSLKRVKIDNSIDLQPNKWEWVGMHMGAWELEGVDGNGWENSLVQPKN